MRRTILIAIVIAALSTGLASGEIKQQGNLRLTFAGRLAPKKLPRTALAPVTVRVRGKIGTADGGRPPQLRRLEFAFNRYGKVSTVGLPTCASGELEGTTTAGAREACGPALVGRGSFRAFVDLAGRKPVPFNGEALAFNSEIGGERGLLLHIYGSRPTNVTFVLPFAIRRIKKGEFGTSFVARPPKIAGEIGYITDLQLKLGRRYTYGGKSRSYLSARCAAPVGLPGAVFTLAKGSFSFDNGQRITSTLSGNCWVR
jgi:hypothetical protein